MSLPTYVLQGLIAQNQTVQSWGFAVSQRLHHIKGGLQMLSQIKLISEPRCWMLATRPSHSSRLSRLFHGKGACEDPFSCLGLETQLDFWHFSLRGVGLPAVCVVLASLHPETRSPKHSVNAELVPLPWMALLLQSVEHPFMSQTMPAHLLLTYSAIQTNLNMVCI